MKVADIPIDTRFFCLFKGDPGSGKSIAASSYPDAYFFDMDYRMKSIKTFWTMQNTERARQILAGLEYDRYTDFLSVNRRLEQFMGYCPFKTLVFDGITSGADVILNTMIATRDAGAKRNVRGGVELYQIEDYGGESRGLQTIIDNLKALSFRWELNVIVTAHILETAQTDLKSRITTVSRTLLTAGKKVAAKLPKDFDEAYHFDVQPSLDVSQPPRYTIITHNVGQDWAKTALPLPMRLDFTDAPLYDIIMAELAKHPEIVQPVNSSSELPIQGNMEM